jgi:hypothetical protein
MYYDLRNNELFIRITTLSCLVMSLFLKAVSYRYSFPTLEVYSKKLNMQFDKHLIKKNNMIVSN